MTFEQVYNEQDKLINEFVKKVNVHILEIYRELDEINIDANVIFFKYFQLFYFKRFYLVIRKLG